MQRKTRVSILIVKTRARVRRIVGQAVASALHRRLSVNIVEPGAAFRVRKSLVVFALKSGMTHPASLQFGSSFQRHSPAKIGLNHECRSGDRNVLVHWIRHDRTDRHRFFLSFVMVQFSANAYSPRLVLWVARDPVMPEREHIQLTLPGYWSTHSIGWVAR